MVLQRFFSYLLVQIFVTGLQEVVRWRAELLIQKFGRFLMSTCLESEAYIIVQSKILKHMAFGVEELKDRKRETKSTVQLYLVLLHA
jgi:hypothetical protein